MVHAVVVFDRHRRAVQSLGDEPATTTHEAIQGIVALLVERVEAWDRQVVRWVRLRLPVRSRSAC